MVIAGIIKYWQIPIRDLYRDLLLLFVHPSLRKNVLFVTKMVFFTSRCSWVCQLGFAVHGKQLKLNLKIYMHALTLHGEINALQWRILKNSMGRGSTKPNWQKNLMSFGRFFISPLILQYIRKKNANCTYCLIPKDISNISIQSCRILWKNCHLSVGWIPYNFFRHCNIMFSVDLKGTHGRKTVASNM